MDSWLSAALDHAEEVVQWCWDFIVGNDFLQMLLVISIIPIGFAIFGAGRRAVGGTHLSLIHI